MEWRNLGKFPSGINIWEPVDPPETHKDIVIHSFAGWEGFTVSFGRHQISRFKSVNDAIKFSNDIVESRIAIDEKTAQKEARKTQRSKKNGDDKADV